MNNFFDDELPAIARTIALGAISEREAIFDIGRINAIVTPRTHGIKIHIISSLGASICSVTTPVRNSYSRAHGWVGWRVFQTCNNQLVEIKEELVQ